MITAPFWFVLVYVAIATNISSVSSQCLPNSTVAIISDTYYCINVFPYSEVRTSFCISLTVGNLALPNVADDLLVKRMIALQFAYNVQKLKLKKYVLTIDTGIDLEEKCTAMDPKLLNVSSENTCKDEQTNFYYACYIKIKNVKVPNRHCSLSYEKWNLSSRNSCKLLIPKDPRSKCAFDLIKFKKEIAAQGKLPCQIPNLFRSPIHHRCNQNCVCIERETYKNLTENLPCDCETTYKVPEILAFYKPRHALCEPTVSFYAINSSQACSNTSCVINGSMDVCKYSLWNEFEKCSKCGKWTKSRRRRLEKENENCVYPKLEDTVDCMNFQDCDTCQIYYEPSSAWSVCNQSCGFGSMTRTVSKVTYGLNVLKRCTNITSGTNEIRDCPGIPCDENCTFTEWTDWSLCDVPCGNGTKTRNRTLISEPVAGGICTWNETMETKDCSGQFRECQQNCSYSEWSEYTKCPHCQSTNGPKKGQKRTRIILNWSTPFADEKCNENWLEEVVFNCTERKCQELGKMTEEEKQNVLTVGIILMIIVIIVIVVGIVVLVFVKRRRLKKAAVAEKKLHVKNVSSKLVNESLKNSSVNVERYLNVNHRSPRSSNILKGKSLKQKSSPTKKLTWSKSIKVLNKPSLKKHRK